MATTVPKDPNMTPEVRRYLEAQDQTTKALATSLSNLGTAAALDVGTAALNVVQINAAVKLPAVDGSLLTGITGRLTAGTPLVQNPFAIATTTTQAHGLGAFPDFVIAYFECLSAELGYGVGERVTTATSTIPTASYDATNTYFSTVTATTVILLNKTTHVGANITAAKWKVVVTPYKIT